MATDEPVVKTEAKNVDLSSLNTNAVAYFDNIKTAIFATGSNLPGTKSESQDEENPLIEKLQNMQIVDEESSQGVSFFTMEIEEQEEFLNEWAILQAEQLSEKMKEAPDLIEIIPKCPLETTTLITSIMRFTFSNGRH